jgi:regulator of chromosome condensation
MSFNWGSSSSSSSSSSSWGSSSSSSSSSSSFQQNKRRRDSSEVGMSKNEYYAAENAMPRSSPGTWKQASSKEMSKRKTIHVPKNLTKALKAATKDLNTRFVQYLKEQQRNVNNQMVETWEDVLKDYVTYARHLKMHYRRSGGLVLACGSNDCGQSGHGRTEDGAPNEPEGLAVVQSLKNIDIRYIATGGIHSLAVSSSGRVFSCGCNDDGALGRPTKAEDDDDDDKTDSGSNSVLPEFDFYEIQWPKTTVHVVQVAAGDCHSIALGLNGSVYTWGSYKDKDSKSFYNTGHQSTCKGHTQKAPNLVSFNGSSEDGQIAVEIACGSSFNIARMRDGSVMSWGLGESGQLGRGKPPVLRPDPHSRNYDTLSAHTFHLTPQPIQFDTNKDGTPVHIHAIGCGSYHGLCASRENVYSFGLNNYGQLGCDPDGALGQQVNVPHRIVDLEAGKSVGVICAVSGKF